MKIFNKKLNRINKNKLEIWTQLGNRIKAVLAVANATAGVHRAGVIPVERLAVLMLILV